MSNSNVMSVLKCLSQGNSRLIPVLSSVLMLSASCAVSAEQTQVWLIGGGNHIENSQGQIEQNVKWLESLLDQKTQKVHTYFSAGSAQIKDVAYWAASSGATESMQPLANVFAPIGSNDKHYKHHELNHVKGGTKKSDLMAALEKDFQGVAQNQNVLLVYNGHGGLTEHNVDRNYLKLWGDERLDIAELDTLLDQAPETASVRFVLTQCYSGSFHQLVYDNPFSDTFAKQQRCGFLAESAYRQAEGCELGINENEFRDYTTYFFAALTEKTRLNEPLAASPDLNGDGKISFREAHLYTLRHAESKDLSRATSEVYLEQWQPWYLRWETSVENTDSQYWDIARHIADQNQLPIETSKLLEQQAGYKKEIARQLQKTDKIHRQVKQLQQQIQLQLQKRWPELFNPYTFEYHRVIAESLDLIQQSIVAHPEYQNLVAMQQQYQALLQKTLETKRESTQIDKIFRMKKLARLERQFIQYADKDKQREHQQLLACEEGFLD